jgi:hypothetical protein
MFLTDEFTIFVLDNRGNTALSYVSDVLIELVSGTDYEITHWTRYQCLFLAFLFTRSRHGRARHAAILFASVSLNTNYSDAQIAAQAKSKTHRRTHCCK